MFSLRPPTLAVKATTPAGLMSALAFGHALTLNFALGVSIVFISMSVSTEGWQAGFGGLSKSAGGPCRQGLSLQKHHPGCSTPLQAASALPSVPTAC